MVELCPASFADLVDRMFLELRRQEAVFDLPRRKWYLPHADGPDLGVRFLGHRAATPVGPASGPHTQMAQNLVLCWLAGARILELKTVQINDRLEIGRPCIDAANVCYNIEWSQELRIGESLSEYVAGAMLIHMLRQMDLADGVDLTGSAGDTVFDMSVGYDLAGIKSEPVVRYIESLKNARAAIDELRLQIPARHRRLRDLDYPAQVSDSITLSTFHGCPADEIERICTFLLGEMDVDVVVKMNPPMLGRERLEHLLHEVMGYSEIRVNPSAYTSGLRFDEAVDMCRRLQSLAARLGRQVGAKFSNTLEVVNHRQVFPSGNSVMYLSGQPLHVITLTLAECFREAMGPELPLSFSAGVDQRNFPDMVAAGFVPVTTCTDLLRTGGYGRLPRYLAHLEERMAAVGAGTIADYLLDVFGQRAAVGGDVPRAAAGNLAHVAEQARGDERYRAAANRAEPRRVDSHLALFDCLTCDKCVPVCPNDANFTYDLRPQTLAFTDWVVGEDGDLRPGERRELVVKRKHQIANFADFCNECGNCDTFCPEYGGPFIEKPSFFGSIEGWRRHRDRDGFHVQCSAGDRVIHGRMKGGEYQLAQDLATGDWTFDDGDATSRFAARTDWQGDAGRPDTVTDAPPGHVIDMLTLHTLRLLLEGILDPGRVHQVNVRFLTL